ncbi:ATP-binding cassette domain-containing protein [Bosea rubneri]|uniref:ATP-binding cassette domain-containing protein n=1 Tax=Bosea rubneri TaxID=3075434 RepID=A0ABU3S813_9HYPH|nr:ATP-binding cassette domain-containing protein [Bosea sp. ZW T0_25]MDU0340927.1 ATP-binding cassette domain-containing protein [Bosea sp. ZW T0_25]
MEVASPPSLRLAPRQTYELTEDTPVTLGEGEADLYLALPDGRQRFVVALPVGALLPARPDEARFFVRAGRGATLDPGGDIDGAILWLEALSRATGTPAGAFAHPEDVETYARETERLFAILAERFEAEQRRSVSEANAQARRSDKAFTETLGGFDRLLAGRFRRLPAGVHSPLAIAATRLVEAKRIKPLPIRERDGEDRDDFIERFAATHGLRPRPIRLDTGAEPEGDGPFLVFDAQRRPLILRPRLRGGFLIEDPETDAKPRLLQAADWHSFAPEAFAFYATLPAGKLSYREITRFGLRDSAWDFALLAACGIIGALLALLTPIASEQIANIAVHTADTVFLADLLAILAVALMAETSFFVIGRLAELRAQGRSGLALHAAMVDRLLRLPPAALRASTTLVLATQMETVEKFRRSLLAFATNGMLALVNGLAAAALVAFVSPAAGLVAIGLVLVLLGITALIGWAQFKAIYEGERMDVIVLAFVYDLVRLVPIVRAARLEKRAFSQWSENFLAFQSRLMRSATISNRLAVIEPFWDMIVLALCFAAIAYAGAASHIGAGEAIVFVMALGRLVRSGKELAHAVMGSAKLMPMAKLGRSLIEQEIEPLTSGAPVESLSGAVEMSGVSFFYGARRVLSDVDLAIAPGEFVGLVGASGSGKSTALALLTGLERPHAGRVLLDGSDVAGLDRRQLTRHLGVVMQNSRLFSGSIYDNIRGVSGIDLALAWDYAAEVGLADELRALPMGLHTIIGETGAGLSTGQVQRVLIARALARRPSILVLDEAMSALDGASQQHILGVLERLAVTRILVAHRPSTLAKADRLILFERGSVVGTGTPAEIMRRHATFHAPGREAR